MDTRTETKTYHVTGLMSGTSLDGLDLACCTFSYDGGIWNWRILRAETLPYPAAWKERLENMQYLSGRELIQGHVDYGHYLGQAVRDFLESHRLPCDLVSSHGHTIFHRPDRGYTFQAGEGSAIAAECGRPVVSDLRSGDVARGGQGAPLVPLGDRLLFGEYGACLNIGGFANLSFEQEGKRIAYDICPVNKVLNPLAQRMGLEYDRDGEVAAGGSRISGLLETLDRLGYYAAPTPKSLGEEWLRENIDPLLIPHHDRLNDLMHTLVLHMAGQIARAIAGSGAVKVLATGGGVYHRLLLEQIRKGCSAGIILPSDELVQFKEALVFALLGLLRYRGEDNVLASVTGAGAGHPSGALHLP